MGEGDDAGHRDEIDEGDAVGQHSFQTLLVSARRDCLVRDGVV
jgi:hypothetical protein